MALQKGMTAVRESLERSEKNSGPKTYTETNWFYWQGGETKSLRFLTDADDIYVVPIHENVFNHEGKKKTFVCRSAFDAPCELCQSEQYKYKRDMGYGIAVLREEVYQMVDGKNKLVGYRDVKTEYEETVDGKVVKKECPYVGIVKGGMRNFWNQIAAISDRYGSLLEREIDIQRHGADAKTTYMAFPGPEKIITNKEGQEVDPATGEKAIITRYKKFMPDVESFLNRIGSMEYYDAQLRGIVKDKDKKNNSYPSSAPSTVVEEEYGEDDYAAIDEETTADRLARKMAEKV